MVNRICKECKKEKPHEAKGLCKTCYNKQLKPRIIRCNNCKENRAHEAKGLCRSCYSK